MADYKGLTIRIGGDTSNLNAALKASTKAASSLQSQIRQITRAMRFDPGDLGNVDTRMRLTTNRAEALYAKIRLLQSGYDELGRSAVSVDGATTSVRALAESTENVAMAASLAKERYNDMTATLASRYRELEARAKEAGKSMSLNALSRQGTDETFETQMAQLRELGVVTDEEIAKLREMRAVWGEAFDSSEAYKAASQLEGMAVDMQRFESEARDATATVRELNAVSDYAAGNWQESTARVKALDSELSECAKQAMAYEAALREDPSNMNAAVGRLKALSNEYDLAAGKARELSRQVAAYEGRLSETLAKHKNLPQFIKLAGDEWQQVQGELSEARGKAAALEQSLQRLNDMQAPVEEIRRLEGEVAAARGKVESLSASAAEMDAKFETAKECSELQRLQQELAQTEAHAKSVKDRMDLTSLGGKSMLNASTLKSAGMTMYSTLTPAITMLGWRTITAAQDMDSAYRDMRKTVEGTESQFEQLKQGAIEFSKTHVTSAEQILQIESIGGELGIATDSLQAFAETVSNLDVATNLDTEEAASSLGKLANITHMSADQYDNYADALVRLGNNGASTEDQIVDIATRIGSMGTIVGMTVPEILALSSSIASTGMKTEASGTAVANTIADMESAVAGGGEALEAFASVSGMSAEEFAQTWEDKPIAAFEAFVKGLNRIEEDGGSADATLEQMGITGTRQKQAIEGLMQTIDGLDDSLLMSQHAWEGQSDQWGAAGDAAREAQKKAEGFSGQISILSNIGSDAMASLAEGATPLMGVLTDVAQGALDLFDGMDEGAKTFTVVGLGIAALAGPALTMVSTFITAKQNIAAFAAESSAMGRAIAIMKSGFTGTGMSADGMRLKLMSLGEAAKTVGRSLASGLATAAVVAGVSIAVAAISDYIRKIRETEEAARGAGDTIASAIGGAAASNEQAVGGIMVDYDQMVSKMAENNRKLQASADETYGNTALIDQYGEAVAEALEAYNEGDRSAESMANLKTQLDLYNGVAGTSISFTEDETGALGLMKDGAELSADAFDRLTESMINAAKGEFFKEGYETKMGDYRTAIDAVAQAEANAENAARQYGEAMAHPLDYDSDTLSQLKWQMDEASTTLANAKARLGETTSAMNQYEEGMRLMSEAQLENAGSGTMWMAGNDMLQASIWQSGQSVTGFAHMLDALNMDYDELSANSETISAMGASWNGTLSSVLPGLTELGLEIDGNTASLLGLSAVQVDDKTYYVSDDGTILDQSGQLMAFDYLKVGNKLYRVSDGGTIWDGINAVGTLRDGVASLPDGNVTVTATVDSATSEVTGWVAETDATQATTKTTSDTSEADSQVQASVDRANSLTGTIGVDANTSSFWNAVNGIDGRTVGTVYVNVEKRGGSYTGGYSQTPWDLASATVPRMATGAIVTRPLLTNNGWVGEAGAEAVLNWGTGGAVVPLTNRKYMEPIAEAIAKNMGGSGDGRTVNLTVNLNYKAGDDASRLAFDVANKLDAILSMEG